MTDKIQFYKKHTSFLNKSLRLKSKCCDVMDDQYLLLITVYDET